MLDFLLTLASARRVRARCARARRARARRARAPSSPSSPSRGTTIRSNCAHCDTAMRIILTARRNDRIESGLLTFMHVLYEGWAPIHWLAAEGCVHGVRVLLEYGADVSQQAARHQPPAAGAHGCFGETPLRLAVRGGHRQTRCSSKRVLRYRSSMIMGFSRCT